ncbi:MAG: type II toxin-antitoxin system PemK/MazF family toxin [Candidatus Vogelbacteria bacterium]|nr:type II toxin-antitoxin system PemK/MazF family toxin [Candidatus Vogelbacteria bacterium]
MVLAVPLTTKLEDNPYYFTFIHHGIIFAVILSQIRLLSTNRLTRRIRRVDSNIFKKIKDKIIEKDF